MKDYLADAAQERRNKATRIAEQILVATHAFGVEYNTNQYGGCLRVSEGNVPEGAIPWDSQEFRSWLRSPRTPDGHELEGLFGESVVLSWEGEDYREVRFGVTLSKWVIPTEAEYEDYLQGYEPMEAQVIFGDLTYNRSRKTAVVVGGEVEKFLRLVTPACWG